MKNKKCSCCKITKDSSEFFCSKRDGLASYCKQCKQAKMREYRKKPDWIEKEKTYSKQYWIVKGKKHSRKRICCQYGLTVEEYNNLHTQQSGLCAICKQPEVNEKYLSIDHNHSNGKVRGLLCFACNTSLGGFRDNIDYLKSAIHYLQKE